MQFEKDLTSPHKYLFLEARALLLSFDDVTEVKKPKITTYMYARSALCHMRTRPHGIDLGFLKGSLMQDEMGQLTGTGKYMRVLSLESLDEALLLYYVTQALELNER